VNNGTKLTSLDSRIHGCKLYGYLCGTLLTAQPEIFKKAGHGKPVDIWAIGVISYFLLCGYTPFDRDSQYEEMQAICNGDYKFEPVSCLVYS
jgi:serine/threonine protein kinase